MLPSQVATAIAPPVPPCPPSTRYFQLTVDPDQVIIEKRFKESVNSVYSQIFVITANAYGPQLRIH